MYIARTDYLSLSNLRTLLQIAAGHIRTSKRDLSVLSSPSPSSKEQLSSQSPAWTALAKEAGYFQPKIPMGKQQTLYASPVSQLLKLNSRFLLKLDLLVASLLEKEILDRTSKLSVQDLNALLSLHSRMGNLGIVLAYFSELKGREDGVSREAYWMVMQSHIKSGKMDRAMEWYHRMLLDSCVKGPGIRIFRMLVKEFVFTGRDLDLALSYLMEYERLNFRAADLGMYTLLMQHFEKKGRMEDVRFLFRRMLVWGDDIIKPDVKAWNIYILSFKDIVVDAGSIVSVGDLETHGIQPDVGTFYALMEVCASRNDILGAGEHCKEALRRGFILSTRMWHVLFLSLVNSSSGTNSFTKNESLNLESPIEVPFSMLNSDPYFHSLYLRWLTQNGHVKTAVESVKSSLSSGLYPRRFTYDILIKSLLKHGHYDYAIKLFEQMQQSYPVGLQGYNNLIIARLRNLEYYENPKTELCKVIDEIFAEMKTNSLEPTTDTFNTILLSLIHLQNTELAFHFLSTYEFHPNIITYTILLKLVSPNFLTSDLKKIAISSAVTTTSSSSNDLPNPCLEPPTSFDRIFFTVLFSALSAKKSQNADQFTHFSTLFLSLAAHGHLDPDAACFNSLMAGFHRLNQPERALQVYECCMVSDFKIVATVKTLTILMSVLPVCSGGKGTLSILVGTGKVVEVGKSPKGIYEALVGECGYEPDLGVFRALAKSKWLRDGIVDVKWLIGEMRRWGVDEEEAVFRRAVKYLK
ncbi:UNVERIFIED_CONTAM: hypothetical protein HDU68_004840 [Siphonaria sp. JEL0065]|nr:hypothetical protein HDU68_004840 [Siphonaria sp. JEL0065]